MPKACLLGVNNVPSSFNRCKETIGFVWKMYHSEVKTGIVCKLDLKKSGITKSKFLIFTVLQWEKALRVLLVAFSL